MKVKLRRNRHNLSHYMCGTCFLGEITPVGLVEVSPGDTFNHRINSLIRFNALNAPIMHRVSVATYSFFIPMRILWDGFENFITRTTPGGFPSMTLGNISADADCKRLADYLGLNTDSVVAGSTTEVNALPFWAYNKIYNEWFRDEDLVAVLPETSLTAADYSVQRAAWRKDNFTAARPWPQKGPDITIPLGVSAPVSVDRFATIAGVDTGDIYQGGADTTEPSKTFKASTGQSIIPLTQVQFTGEADLTGATSATINELRRAFNLQALAERLANFGSRYPEYLASMGVKSSDARLQIPEYLGGGKTNMSFSEVLQTAEGTTTPVGEMRGHAIAPSLNAPYRRFFEEHGYVMTLMVVRPQAIYNNVIDRMWFHGLVDGANDFYTPELERIGFQEILNAEVYPTNPAGGDAGVWGYAPRYKEYRQQLSRVSGLFRVGATLDYWTWARGFSSLPALNQAFIECDPDSRVFADATSDPVLFAVNHQLIAQRMLTPFITGRII